MPLCIGAILCAGALVLVYFTFDPSEGKLFPKCPFLLLTGYQCPGCGSQRAIHCLLHGDIIGAWRYNAFLVLCLPIIATMLLGWLLRKKKPVFYNAVTGNVMVFVLTTLIVAWWILRNCWI